MIFYIFDGTIISLIRKYFPQNHSEIRSRVLLNHMENPKLAIILKKNQKKMKKIKHEIDLFWPSMTSVSILKFVRKKICPHNVSNHKNVYKISASKEKLKNPESQNHRVIEFFVRCKRIYFLNNIVIITYNIQN